MDKNDKMLSFDKLKAQIEKKAAPAGADNEIEALLASLDAEEEIQANESGVPEEAEPAEEEGFSLQEQQDDIFEDILAAVESTEFKAEPTARRTKYTSEEKHFVDVENIYQAPREEEPPVLERAIPRFEEDVIRKSADDAPGVQAAFTGEPAAAEPEEEPEAEEEHIKTFNEMFKSMLAGFFPNKRDRTSEIIRKVIMDISVFTLIGCGIWFGVLMAQKNNAGKQLENIKGQIIQTDDTQSEDEAWAEFFAQYPNVQLPEGMMAKYAYLYAINPHLVGWIRIPNSIIDVQVVQAADNEEYLKKDFYGNYSRYGCPFMDYRDDPKYLSQNTIIYGHHMSDGLVFAELDKYKTIDGFMESPIIEFDTLYQTYKFKVYAAFITNSEASQDNDYIFNYTITKFSTQEKFDGYMACVDQRKLYSTGVSVDYSDKLITLSTCSYEFSDARLVVMGRLLRDGESETVDTSLATVSENPRYPQIWYDKKGQTNPYANAEKWYINGDPSTITTAPATENTTVPTTAAGNPVIS